MKAAMLLTFLLLIALPQVSALTADLDRNSTDVELGERGTLLLTVTSDGQADVNITFEAPFSSFTYTPNTTVVIIVFGPDDGTGNGTVLLEDLDGVLNLTIEFDASSWRPRGKVDDPRTINITVTDGNETFQLNATVRAYHEWKTSVDGLKFLLALFPLISIFIGIAFLKRDGLTMSVVGWLIAAVLAATFFHTPGDVVAGATAIGIIKAFGISIAVLFTMLMIFLMKEVGSLEVISDVIKRVVSTKEEQALFIGIAFGSFLTSLGVTTPAMFPPLLLAMGFSPFAAVMISVLGYNATTSFALLSIPVTIPADIGGIDATQLAWKISLFLPVLSVMLSIAMLWLLGGKASVKKGIVPALLTGLAIAFSCLLFVWSAIHPLVIGGVSIYVPLRIVGVMAGLVAMVVIYVYHRVKFGKPKRSKKRKRIDKRAAFIAFFPWILLTILAAITSVSQVQIFLEDLLGNAEIISVFADQKVDLNILSQIYTWILVATLISIPVLKPTKKQLNNAFTLWLKRGWKPFVAFSMYFSIAYIMFFTGLEVVNGVLIPSEYYVQYNMNLILGTSLAVAFGTGFVYVAGSLGVFGAFVGGSETASNVMFLGVQRSATEQTGTDFMTAYGAHAAAGGIASAITPAKITNAVVLIGEDKALEAKVMRANTLFVILSTIAIGLLTALFISLNL